MDLRKKQLIFRRPKQVAEALNIGIRALSEAHNGSTTKATAYCINRIDGLSEATLSNLRGKQPPAYTRDGGMFLSLIWILLVDGMLPHAPHERQQIWFFDLVNALDLFASAISENNLPTLAETLHQSMSLQAHVDIPNKDIIGHTLARLWLSEPSVMDFNSRHMPVYNRIFIGRDEQMSDIKMRLGVLGGKQPERLTVVRGFPGVGKTATLNRLIHDDTVQNSFEDGILWASLGINGNVGEMLRSWAQQLGAKHLINIEEIPTLLDGMRAVLSKCDMLIVVDDIWTKEQGNLVKHVLDLQHNTVLLATRFTDIAEALADTKSDIYVLPSLTIEASVDLLSTLAPNASKIYHARMPQLAQTVEGLPLALCVAAPLVQNYHDMGFDVDALIDEFEDNYNRLLQSESPTDRFDEQTGRTPTIELLFKRSVETLSEEGQYAFRALGVFQHKPSTFDFEAMKDVWFVKNPEELTRLIVGRGLLDVTSDQRFRMHQTLHMYANKLLDDHDSSQG